MRSPIDSQGMEHKDTQPQTPAKAKKWPLTTAQLDLIAAVHKLRSRRGISPSYKELMEELGLSLTVVATRARLLRKRGYLDAGPGTYRNLYVTRRGHLALGAASR